MGVVHELLRCKPADWRLFIVRLRCRCRCATRREPVVATPHFSGYVEAYLGGLQIPDFQDDNTYWVYGGAGRVNAPINDRWNIQGDVIGDHARFRDNFEVTGLGGALHAFWRNPSSFAIGAFGTYTHFNVDEFNGNYNTLSAGPEAQVYLGNFTLYGQAYYGELDLEGYRIPTGIRFLGRPGCRQVLRAAEPSLRCGVWLPPFGHRFRLWAPGHSDRCTSGHVPP